MNSIRFLIDKIPIKTFGEWKDTSPGFTQVDLIAHNGGNVYGGFFLNSLCNRRLHRLDNLHLRTENSLRLLNIILYLE
ncbi:hypothetical protein LEP1GSC043_0150 [Leptospira weilii str. Ecochallenge]|uniref:Uncharacterized protein n=1 Tax=Leptospira weilii str. Ecochallenge TaxID=1049986 RepID=N1UA29_9LEPT|nr:hypothetical protein LEP1GSC043_0150 [Leptospira weilii str. Ecochallenge]